MVRTRGGCLPSEDLLEAVGFSPWRGRVGGDGKPSVVLEALNITSLATAFDSLVERGSAMFLTKHATPQVPRGVAAQSAGKRVCTPHGTHGP